jgi:hypothetical protein
MSQHSAEDPDYFSPLNARAQALLIDFVNADLDLAFTFLQTAAIEAKWDDIHAGSAIEKAEAALRRALPCFFSAASNRLMCGPRSTSERPIYKRRCPTLIVPPEALPNKSLSTRSSHRTASYPSRAASCKSFFAAA